MKFYLSTILLLACALVSSAQSFVQLDGPTSNPTCFAIIAYDDIVLAGVGSKLFRSTDSGSNFEEIMDDDFGSAFVDPRCFSHYDGVVVMGTNNGDRVYRSTDDGATWDPVYEGLPQISGFPSAVPSFACENNGVFYMAGTNFIRKSEDLGLTWLSMDIDGLCYGLNTSNGKVFCSPGGDPHVSEDDGNTWTPLAVPVYAEILAAQTVSIVENNDVMFCSTVLSAGAGLFKSFDSGSTWEQCLDFSIGKHMDVIDGQVYLSHLGGLSRTADDGVTWETVLLGAATSYAGHFDHDENGNLYYATNQGLKRFDLNSEEGEDLPFPLASVTAIAYSGGNMLAVADGGLQVSSDNGLTWTDLSDQFALDVEVTGLISDGTSVYVSGNAFGIPYLYVSTDDGMTFSLIAQDFDLPFFDVLSFNPVMVASMNGILVSQDDGQTFEVADLLDVDGVDVDDQVSFHEIRHTGALTIAAGQSGIAYSNDNGLSWTYAPSEYCYSATGWEDRLIAIHNVAWPLHQIRQSTDGGVTWENFSDDLGTVQFQPEFLWMSGNRVYCQVSSLDPANPGTFWSVGESETNWTQETAMGMIPDVVISFSENDEGEWTLGTKSTSAWTNGSGGPTDIVEVIQDRPFFYPNPAKESIQFTFQIPLVEVYNLCGQLVLSESMVSNLSIDALQQGVYLVKAGDNLSRLIVE